MNHRSDVSDPIDTHFDMTVLVTPSQVRNPDGAMFTADLDDLPSPSAGRPGPTDGRSAQVGSFVHDSGRSLTQQGHVITNTRLTMIGKVAGHDWASSPTDVRHPSRRVSGSLLPP